MARPRKADPCVMVVLGAAGDLAKRKLMPALYNLRGQQLLGDGFSILGVAREAVSDEAYRQKIAEDLEEFAAGPLDEARAAWVAERATFMGGPFDDPATFDELRERLANAANILFYLATPPGLFAPIVEMLGTAGLTDEAAGCWRRVIVEKPFGHDLASAQDLNKRLLAVLAESQIYRIDHYLGKETVQNVMTFRFANGIFEPIWNRRYIEQVQITAAETVGVEERGGYYDTAGAVRDMVQNHLFQLLAVTTMEPPASFLAEPVRDERVKVLRAVQPFTDESARRDVVRGQYAEGTVGGEVLPAYRAEPKVAEGSQTETYAALKLMINNWRWAEVPFYLRTGKRLPSRVTEIAIQFKKAPLALFRDTPVECMQSNWLIIRIQPQEGISLQFEAKRPGPRVELGTVKMEFSYADYFGNEPNTGYETLLYDCMEGDATLFHRADIVEVGWSIVAPILDAWNKSDAKSIETYAAGSWGPPCAAELMRRDGKAWDDPTK